MVQIEINRDMAEWAEALDPKYRYIFIKGGRSSGKSHEIGAYLCERSFTEKDLKVVCLREVQKSIKRSSKQLIMDKLEELKLVEYYDPVETEVRKTLDNGLFLFQGMNDLTADNVKSLEGFKISWFEEAQNASFKSLKTLRPTIRTEGSQLIFTWNPKLPSNPIDELCGALQNEPDVLVIHINYTENPFLSESIIREINLDRANNPDDFNHIWLGDYDTSFQGHFYAKLVQEARDDGRVCSVPRKHGVDVISAWDLGRNDHTAIWVAQVVGLETRVIDYMQDNFQDLEYYVDWMKDKDYHKGITCLPHDGAHERLGMKGSIKSQLRGMNFKTVKTLKSGSIEGGRTLAKSLLKECWFDKIKCKEGLAALSHYHTQYDENRGIYKEVHDWSSHGADAFRYLAQALTTKPLREKPKVCPRIPQPRGNNFAWMN